MKEQNNEIWYWAGGIAGVALLGTTLLLYRKKKTSKALSPASSASYGSDHSAANPTSTNNNVLPSGFINWKGGSSYLFAMPRGIRNNNPGNIVRSGSQWHGKLPAHQNKDNSFEMFIAPEYGVRAMIKLLQNYMAKGFNTIEKIIAKYAPSTENNTEGYIRSVSQQIKVHRGAVLKPTKNTLRQLVFVMARIETGGSYLSQQLFEKAYAML